MRKIPRLVGLIPGLVGLVMLASPIDANQYNPTPHHGRIEHEGSYFTPLYLSNSSEKVGKVTAIFAEYIDTNIDDSVDVVNVYRWDPDDMDLLNDVGNSKDLRATLRYITEQSDEKIYLVWQMYILTDTTTVKIKEDQWWIEIRPRYSEYGINAQKMYESLSFKRMLQRADSQIEDHPRQSR
jgi:hypothetical protein